MKENIISNTWYKELSDDEWLFSEERAREEGTEAAQHLITRSGMLVYDCPCGDARVSFYLAKKGALVTGMDINPRFIEKAKERFAEAGLEGSFRVGDLRDVSYPGGCDLYFSWFNSFGYFTDEENRFVMKRIADCIRPGGRLVMENPIPGQVIAILNKKYEGSDNRTERSYDSEYKRMNIFYRDQGVWASVRIYDRQEYTEMFEASGLKLIESYSEHFTTYSEEKMRMILIAEKIGG